MMKVEFKAGPSRSPAADGLRCFALSPAASAARSSRMDFPVSCRQGFGYRRQYRRRFRASRSACQSGHRHGRLHARGHRQSGDRLGRRRRNMVVHGCARRPRRRNLVPARRPRSGHPRRAHAAARRGAPLSAVTTRLARKLGVAAAIVPASDDPVRTFVATDEGELEFQHYFVRRHCAPRVSSLSYRNADTARPAPVGGRAMDRDGNRGGDHLPVQSLSQHRAHPGDAGRARLAQGPPLPGCGSFPDRCRAGAERPGGEDHGRAWNGAVRARRGALLCRTCGFFVIEEAMRRSRTPFAPREWSRSSWTP